MENEDHEIINELDMKVMKLEIQEWLERLFGQGEIPVFEETEEVIKTLYKMMKKNKEAERDIKEIIKTEQKQTEIYKNKADEMCSILDAEPLDLNSETIDAVESIASLAFKLKLKEPTVTNFLLALTETSNKEMELKEINIMQENVLESFKEKMDFIMKTNGAIRSQLQQLTDTVTLQENSQVTAFEDFLVSKCQNYRDDMEKFNDNLAKNNYDFFLEHNQLIQRGKEIDELEKELGKLHSKLSYFCDLPPNDSLTRLKIEAARSELFALEEQVNKLVVSSTESDSAAAAGVRTNCVQS